MKLGLRSCLGSTQIRIPEFIQGGTKDLTKQSVGMTQDLQQSLRYTKWAAHQGDAQVQISLPAHLRLEATEPLHRL